MRKGCPHGKIFIFKRLNLFHVFTAQDFKCVHPNDTFLSILNITNHLGRLFMVIFSLRVNRISLCYGSELNDTDTGIFVNLYMFQQQLQISASARQHQHEQKRPHDSFKASGIARLDRDSRRGNIISDCQVTGGLQS